MVKIKTRSHSRRSFRTLDSNPHRPWTPSQYHSSEHAVSQSQNKPKAPHASKTKTLNPGTPNASTLNPGTPNASILIPGTPNRNREAAWVVSHRPSILQRCRPGHRRANQEAAAVG